MKKIIPFLSLLLMLLLMVAPAYAMESGTMQKTVMTRDASNFDQSEEKIQERMEIHTENLNVRAEKEIKRRIESLNKLITKVNNIKRLSADQKLSFITQIQTEIANLQELNIKIKSDTDPVALKTDVQSIIKSYRVYLLFVPKIEIITAADRMGNVASEMSSLSGKLKTRIDSAQSAGKDMAYLQALLVDMNLKIADAKIQATNAINAALPLTVEGYPGNKTTLKSAHEMLKIGHQDLMNAHHDAQKIIQGLHEVKKDGDASRSGIVKPIKSKSIGNPPPSDIKSHLD